MTEALKLFADINNSKWFASTPIILFLNKTDIFRKKLDKVPLTVLFKDYTGPNEFDEASDYIQSQFASQIKRNKMILTYKICATDTNNVKTVLQAIKKVITTEFLEQLGMFADAERGTAIDNLSVSTNEKDTNSNHQSQ